MFWGWGVGFWFDIRCYIVLYYYIIHILLLNLISYYYTTILYIIIYYSYYYTILFLLFFFLPNILYNPLLILSLLPSLILPFLIFPHSNLSKQLSMNIKRNPSIYPIHSIRVGIWISLFIFQSSDPLQIWPRMFYRSGWLRCDVFDVRCILYYYILYIIYYYIIIYYIILFSSLLLPILFSSPLPFLFHPSHLSSTIFWSIPSPPHPFLPNLSSPLLSSSALSFYKRNTHL